MRCGCSNCCVSICCVCLCVFVCVCLCACLFVCLLFTVIVFGCGAAAPIRDALQLLPTPSASRLAIDNDFLLLPEPDFDAPRNLDCAPRNLDCASRKQELSEVTWGKVFFYVMAWRPGSHAQSVAVQQVPSTGVRFQCGQDLQQAKLDRAQPHVQEYSLGNTCIVCLCFFLVTSTITNGQPICTCDFSEHTRRSRPYNFEQATAALKCRSQGDIGLIPELRASGLRYAQLGRRDSCADSHRIFIGALTPMVLIGAAAGLFCWPPWPQGLVAAGF